MGRVVHFEIHAGDPQRAKTFYESVFGWQFQQFGDNPYWLITTGPDDQRGINGGLTPRQGEIDGQAVIAYVCTVDVDSIDESLAKIKDAGGEQVLEKSDIPGVGTYAYCKDTEGNIFGVLQPVQ